MTNANNNVNKATTILKIGQLNLQNSVRATAGSQADHSR